MLQQLNYKFVLLLIVCVISFACHIDAAATYKFVDLGLQESDRSEAVAVNDNGQVVGSYWMFDNKYYFSWSDIEGIMLISLPETAVIRVLNNAGQIAGNYQDFIGNDRGFIWDSSLGFRDIGTLGGKFTHVYDMNNLGQIVGESESENDSLVDGEKEQHAFIWQNESMIDLGSLSGDLGFLGDRSVATSINDRGQIIGTSNYLVAHKVKLLRMNNRAVVWEDNMIKDIDPTIEPQYNARAISVSNTGLAVYDGKDGYFLVDLETGNKGKIPYAPNLNRDPVFSDNGDIFFYGRDYSGANKKMPADIVCLKDKTIGKFSENWDFYGYVYLPNSFENPQQWKPGSFCGANDFNNKKWVVGSAENIYGERHGVLLTPHNEQLEVDSEVEEFPQHEVNETDPEDSKSDEEKINFESRLESTIDAAFVYHTAGVGEKVQMYRIENKFVPGNYAHRSAEAAYQKILMQESFENVFKEVENLGNKIGCGDDVAFWECARLDLIKKDGSLTFYINAYIQLKLCYLGYVAP